MGFSLVEALSHLPYQQGVNRTSFWPLTLLFCLCRLPVAYLYPFCIQFVPTGHDSAKPPVDKLSSS